MKMRIFMQLCFHYIFNFPRRALQYQQKSSFLLAIAFGMRYTARRRTVKPPAQRAESNFNSKLNFLLDSRPLVAAGEIVLPERKRRQFQYCRRQ